MRKQNAPARKGEGVGCMLGGYSDAHSTTAARIQYIARFGIPLNRAGLIASLAFREARYA